MDWLDKALALGMILAAAGFIFCMYQAAAGI